MQIRLAIIAFAVFIISSCKDEPAEIAGSLFGDNLINAKEYIAGSNEVSLQNVEGEVVKFSSIPYLMLGEYSDPQYGYVKADFATELSFGTRISYSTRPYYHLAQVDSPYIASEYLSTEFRIQYKDNSWLGDTLAKHKVSIYELNSLLDRDIQYSSDFDPTGLYYETPIGELTYEVKNGLVDTLWEESSYTHTLTVDIDDEVGLRIFNADTALFINDEKFRDLFKGVYVTTEKVDDNAGSLLRLSHRSINQGLALRYKLTRMLYDINGNDSVTVTDIIVKSFPVNVESAKVVRYTRDYSESDIDLETINPDKLYLSGIGGSMAKLNITEDFISNLQSIIPDSNTEEEAETIKSLSSVTIKLYIDTLDTDLNYAPSTLYMYYINEDGELSSPTYLTENNIESSILISSGSQSSYEYAYVFNINRDFFQELIYPTQDENIERNLNQFFISTEPYLGSGKMDHSFSFTRVVLHGMTIAADDEDETIKPSKFSVKYVEAQ